MTLQGCPGWSCAPNWWLSAFFNQISQSFFYCTRHRKISRFSPKKFLAPLPCTIVQSCKDLQICSNALNGFIPPAKPNFDRRPRTAKTIYPELPPDQASISIHSCQHWPHSRCKNINTLPLPPFEIRIAYLPTFSRLSIDNYIHSHCAESIWSLHNVFSSIPIQSLTVLKTFHKPQIASSSLHTARQYASHVSRILAAKLSPLPWATSKSAASSITKVKPAILSSQLSLPALATGESFTPQVLRPGAWAEAYRSHFIRALLQEDSTNRIASRRTGDTGGTEHCARTVSVHFFLQVVVTAIQPTATRCLRHTETNTTISKARAYYGFIIWLYTQ